MSPTTRIGASRLLLAPGPRVAEERLLDEVGAAALARHRALAAGDLSAVREPLRVVVPSQSLRQHVAAALVRRAGSLLGVSVQTHWALALELLERAGVPAPRGAALLPVLVQRHARAEAVLASWLGDLDDGYGIVDAAVRDLVDAGLTPALGEALHDAIAASEPAGAVPPAVPEVGRDAVGRAEAVVRVALHALAELEARGLGHRAALLVAAREALERDGAAALPTAALWVHGFADATGLVADWLAALVRAFGACVLVDVPPDPADRERRERAFSQRFVDRMKLVAGRPEELAAAPQPGRALALVRAPGSAAELRAVAADVRGLLDQGAAPESIGIVARRLEPYRFTLGAQLGRLAIPFSVLGAPAGPDTTTRRTAALARLLDESGAAPVDTWLDADAARRADDLDLRVAFHVIGAGRLEQLEAIDLDEALGGASYLPLPVRRGGSAEGDDDDEEAAADEPARRAGSQRNRRRTIAAEQLAAARARALAVLARLRAWPERADFETHLVRLRALVESDLAWTPERPGCGGALEALALLERELPAGLALDREELALLARRALDDVTSGALGGAGAGVQVLSAEAARGRSFAHLFVIGMNRDAFPRAAAEDPLVPDAVRRRLREVLPEIPVKGGTADEERHLFASLLAASPAVALTWQSVSDEGRTRPESPFVARLLLEPWVPAVLVAPPFFEAAAESAARASSPRPAREHAVVAGLRRARGRALEALRAEALREAVAMLPEALRDAPQRPAPETLARVQSAVLRELDAAPPPPGVAPRALGPWFGWMGPSREAPPGDGPEIFATRLEALARCPWQAFLRRELGLEPVPDALAALPAPSALARGRVLHLVLERIVKAVLAEPSASLAEALARGPVRVPWPDSATLDAWLGEAARAAAREEGIWAPGFARALARSVRPMLDAAHAVDWSEPDGPLVLGAELAGELVVHDAAGRPRRIGFFADRADLDADGTLRITDYKSGAPYRARSGGKPATKAETRRSHLLLAIREGRALQGPAYREAARQLSVQGRGEGRYLFLREDVPEEARAFRVPSDDAEMAAAFDDTARAILEAADTGALVPRLATPEQQPPCSWCEVRAACLQGDSGQRARLRAWVSAAAPREAALGPAERALLGILRLGREVTP